MGNVTALANDSPVGMRAIWLARAYSAYDPAGGSAQPTTGSPTATSVTWSPTASTTPATSMPGIAGKTVGKMACIAPDRISESTGLTPLACTLIRTCPGPGSGRGTSARCRTSGSPNVSNITAFMSQTLHRWLCMPRDRLRAREPGDEGQPWPC